MYKLLSIIGFLATTLAQRDWGDLESIINQLKNLNKNNGQTENKNNNNDGFCKLTPHPSVTYSCKLTDPNIISGDRKCNDFEPSGTEVHPSCNDYYYYNGVLGYMYCIDGSWNNVVTCEPECGTLPSNAEPLVINGVSAKRGELPWHAGIYDKRYMPFMQICGGSLVSTTVVLSAAHCFWTDVERVLPAKYFAVGVGKLYRSWSIEEGGQKSDVRDLKVPPRFLGASNNFQDDIAVVVLVTPIVLGNYVRPVCIDFNVLFDERQLQPGNVGKVAGWGLTSQDGNVASQVLKVTELPFVDVMMCIADLAFGLQSYITSDKICAGTKTGTALCKGDSGGGLVFPAVERSVQRWFLRGLVSTAPRNSHNCNANSYTSFTQLRKHDNFVRKHLHNRLSLTSAAADDVKSESSKCVLPPYPEHGSYSLVGRAGAQPGLTLDAASLTVTCDAPYRPDGPAEVHCYNGQWSPPVPECKRFCKLNRHPSVTYSCKLTDPNTISGDRKCNDFEPSGTEVHLRCNDNYYHNGVLRYMNCIDGSWDNVATCEPVTGVPGRPRRNETGGERGETGQGSKGRDGDKSCLTAENVTGECVPYYRCDANGTITTEGFHQFQIIDIRVNGTCESDLDICCLRPDHLADNPITPAPAAKVNQGKENSTGTHRPSACDAVVLSCCNPNDTKQQQRACFASAECGTSFDKRDACSQQSVEEVLDLFATAYAP